MLVLIFSTHSHAEQADVWEKKAPAEIWTNLLLAMRQQCFLSLHGASPSGETCISKQNKTKHCSYILLWFCFVLHHIRLTLDCKNGQLVFKSAVYLPHNLINLWYSEHMKIQYLPVLTQLGRMIVLSSVM